MNRADLERDLLLYLDGELPAARARELRDALAVDPALRELAERHLVLDRLLDELPTAAMPAGLPARIVAAASGLPEPRSRVWPWWLAAALLATSVGAMLWPRARGADSVVPGPELLVPPPLATAAEELDRVWRDIRYIESEWGF